MGEIEDTLRIRDVGEYLRRDPLFPLPLREQLIKPFGKEHLLLQEITGVYFQLPVLFSAQMLRQPGVELRLHLDGQSQTAGQQGGAQIGAHRGDAVVDQL